MLSPTPAIDRSTLHPGTGYLIAPRVPHGLAAVVEGLTREILRHRPEDIYVFAAHHFEKLLKLREQYHAEEYNSHEFNYEFNREFNLWPTKNTEIKKSSNNAWSLEKEIEILEGHRKGLADAEESMEDVSTDKENRKELKQTCSENPTITKRVSKRSKDKETPSDARATKIISQMPGLHGPSKNIQAKDIKQELRKNKLSGEKGKTINRGTEKVIRGERRSRTRSTKSEKGPEEENERSAVMTTVTTTTTATTISTTSRTSTRRPLKKVRRIETESETETERETASKNRFENGYNNLL